MRRPDPYQLAHPPVGKGITDMTKRIHGFLEQRVAGVFKVDEQNNTWETIVPIHM
jgi:hypothetical protein